MTDSAKLPPEEIATLLDKVGLMSGTSDDGHDLLKSDAMSVNKWASGLLAAGGITAGGALTGFAAWLNDPAHQLLAITLVIGAAAVVIAAFALIGWIVTNDVKTRAALQQTRYETRTRIVHDWVELLDESAVLESVDSRFPVGAR